MLQSKYGHPGPFSDLYLRYRGRMLDFINNILTILGIIFIGAQPCFSMKTLLRAPFIIPSKEYLYNAHMPPSLLGWCHCCATASSSLLVSRRCQLLSQPACRLADVRSYKLTPGGKCRRTGRWAPAKKWILQEPLPRECSPSAYQDQASKGLKS